MRDLILSSSSAVRVKEAIAVDYAEAQVRQKWKVRGQTVLFRNPGDHFTEVRDAIRRDGQDLCILFLFIGQQAFQLHELTGAVASPMAPVEDEYDVFLASEIR